MLNKLDIIKLMFKVVTSVSPNDYSYDEMLSIESNINMIDLDNDLIDKTMADTKMYKMLRNHKYLVIMVISELSKYFDQYYECSSSYNVTPYEYMGIVNTINMVLGNLTPKSANIFIMKMRLAAVGVAILSDYTISTDEYFGKDFIINQALSIYMESLIRNKKFSLSEAIHPRSAFYLYNTKTKKREIRKYIRILTAEYEMRIPVDMYMLTPDYPWQKTKPKKEKKNKKKNKKKDMKKDMKKIKEQRSELAKSRRKDIKKSLRTQKETNHLETHTTTDLSSITNRIEGAIDKAVDSLCERTAYPEISRDLASILKKDICEELSVCKTKDDIQCYCE